MIKFLIGPGDLCLLADIQRRRFDKRRERQSAAADIAVAVSDGEVVELPITPSEPGLHGRYDAYDALKLRAVVELERAGMAFGQACEFMCRAGISPAVMFPSGEDVFAAQWLDPGGIIRRVCGTAGDLTRAMPKPPVAAISLNLTAIRQHVAERALARLGLRVQGTNFVGSEP